MGRSKLSSSDKDNIRKLYKSGETIPALMEKYGVTYNTIKRVVNPELYAKHVKQVTLYNKRNSKGINQKREMAFRRFSFTMNRDSDAPIIEALEGKGNITQYIRDLIYADISKKKKGHT